MSYPVVPVVKPAVLSGQTNGKLPDSILVTIPGQAGGYPVRLVAPAARAWLALTAAALAAGHVLKASGPLDSYRPYERQVQEFLERFVTYDTHTGVTKVWEGVRYWLKPGVALAATPGNSNHGLGLAVDTGEELDGDAGPESLSEAGLAWLLAHEQEFGWSHEVQSENWHIRYWAGDTIPAAVLAYELTHMSTVEDDMAMIFEDRDARGNYYVLGADGVPHRFKLESKNGINDVGYIASGRYFRDQQLPVPPLPYQNTPINLAPWISIPLLPIAVLAVADGELSGEVEVGEIDFTEPIEKAIDKALKTPMILTRQASE